MGLVGFYSKFIPNYSTVAAPLTDLTRRGCPNKIVWGEPQERSFVVLKKVLSSNPVLRLSDLPKEFILQTDSSEVGLGAYVLQDIDGQKSPVAYASKKLIKSELNYSVIEKECLALIWAIRKLHVYLYGKDFILETDHQPLVYLSQSKMENGRLMGWALALQPYQCKIRALKGSQNVSADYLFFFFFFFFFTFNILFIHPFFTSVQKNLGGREWQTLHQIYLQVQCIAKTTRSTFLLFYILLNRK